MSLHSELTRLQANVTAYHLPKIDIMTALASKGVTVPAGATLHDVPMLIGKIQGSAVPADSVLIGNRYYHYVRIGNQLWIDENLDYKFDVNGSTITIGTASSGKPTTPTAWYYDDDESTYGIDGTYKCGLLYNWYAANYLDTHSSTLLPAGWRVPSSTDFDTLANTVGGNSNAGTKLKALDNSITTGFPSSWNGTDDYGFGMLPVGYYIDPFMNLGSNGDFWTSTSYNSANAYNRYYYDGATFGSSKDEKWKAFSIRLVKDVS